MLSNASTPFWPVCPALIGRVARSLPLRNWTYRPKYGIESFELIMNTYLSYCFYNYVSCLSLKKNNVKGGVVHYFFVTFADV